MLEGGAEGEAGVFGGVVVVDWWENVLVWVLYLERRRGGDSIVSMYKTAPHERWKIRRMNERTVQISFTPYPNTPPRMLGKRM